MTETNIKVGDKEFKRIHVKTHVIVKEDKVLNLVEKYASEFITPGDWLFISERVVAICQGRAYKIDEVKVGGLAKFLVKFVYKSPYGIGLGRPETMQLAIAEAGALRILLASFIGGIAKLFGKRGVFYKVAGHGVNAIDGPCDYTLPPYNKYAVLGPNDPDKVAQSIADKFKVKAVVIDANDLGVNVLGVSKDVDKDLAKEIFRDNPLGQGSEQTPMAVVKEI